MNRATLTDPALPGLATILDESRLLALLSRRLPEVAEGLDLVGARAIDVQYHPFESASVLVRLKFHEAGTRRTTRQLACIRALRAGETPERPRELIERHEARRRTKAGAREPLRTAWLEMPEDAILFQAFPLDPGLPTLMDIADPQTLREAISRLWRPAQVRARHVKIETLAYTPGSRCALALEILAEDRATGVPQQRHLVGKLHARRAPSRLFAGAWTLWRRAAGRVSIAPPVGFIDSLGLSLQEFVQGGRLSDLAGTATFLKPVRQAARAIAHVHRQHLPLHSERDLAKEATVVKRWLGVLQGILPDRAGDLGRLGDGLLADLEARFAPRCAVHADFHLANILVHRDSVTLVDWDQIAHGDPMLDVGRFLASLRVSALRTRDDAAGLADAGDAFLSTYLAATGDDERRARLFEAGALLTAAAAPFRLQREGWRAQADLLVDETWRCLDASRRGTPVAVPSREALVPFEDRVAWARDPSLMMALLSPLVRQVHGAELDLVECKPRVLHADDERLEVEFDLRGFIARERWSGRVVARGELAHGGRSLVRRLGADRASTPAPAIAGALRLPRVLGHVGSLALVAIEPAPGEPLVDALRRDDGTLVASALGRGMALLETSSGDGVRERSIDDELRAVRRRIEAVAGDGALARRLEAVLSRIEAALSSQPVRLVPTFRSLRLSDLAWDGISPGLAAPRERVLSPAGLCAGVIAGRLATWEIEHEATGLGDAFERAWCDAGAVQGSAFAPFWALGLARAAARAARAGDAATAERLAGMSEERA